MRLESAQELKAQLLDEVVNPFNPPVSRIGGAGRRMAALRVGGIDRATLSGVGAGSADGFDDVQRFLCLGIAPHQKGYRVAVRLQRAALQDSAIVDHIVKRARGEVDIRMVGRIEKRSTRRRARARGIRTSAGAIWHQSNTRPLLIGASIGHVDVTAGTIGGFVERNGATHVLSNNHVLANENRATAGDVIIQRARLDGGRASSEGVARLSHAVRLKRRASNRSDVALARLDEDCPHDVKLLRQIQRGANRRLAGVGEEFLDARQIVYKVGRTTGATKGRVTAFALDAVIVSYEIGNLRFDDQIEIESGDRQPFSDGGDSGSLIVNADMQAVGLLFSGSDIGGRYGTGLTFANPIHTVLSDIKATLLW